jgi:hypothetical protein
MCNPCGIALRCSLLWAHCSLSQQPFASWLQLVDKAGSSKRLVVGFLWVPDGTQGRAGQRLIQAGPRENRQNRLAPACLASATQGGWDSGEKALSLDDNRCWRTKRKEEWLLAAFLRCIFRAAACSRLAALMRWRTNGLSVCPMNRSLLD